MNYIFGKDESEISNDDVFKYNNIFENSNFNNKESESLNSDNKERSGLEQLRYEFTDNICKNQMKYESISEIANFGEDDSDSIFDQKSISFYDQIVPSTKSMHNSNAEYSQKTIVNSIFTNEDSCISESIDKTKASISDLVLSSMRPNTLEIDYQLYNDMNHIVEQTFNNSNQLGFPARRRNRKCGYYRWNRKDDTKMFNELRKVCKQ